MEKIREYESVINSLKRRILVREGQAIIEGEAKRGIENGTQSLRTTLVFEADTHRSRVFEMDSSLNCVYSNKILSGDGFELRKVKCVELYCVFLFLNKMKKKKKK